MTMVSDEGFAKKVMQIAGSAAPCKASAYYDREGDCIEFLARNEEFYAERLDDLVTVYYSEATGEVIGSLVKGVSRFVKRHPNLAILVRAGHVRLSHLFLAGLLCEHPDRDKLQIVAYEKKQQVYRDLLDRAEETQAVAAMA